MARNGSGTYNRPVSDYVFNTVISETDVNTEMDQIATALSDSIAKDGQTNPTANLPMATYKHTGVGNASARDQYAAAGQVQDSSFIDCGTAGGTKNALTLTPSPAITAYASGQTFRFKVGSTSSDSTVTVAVSGLATKAVEIDDSALSSSVVLEANKHYEIKYDGTAFQATRLSGGGLTAVDGVTIENTGGAIGVKDGGLSVAKLADGTDGELITWDASGNAATVGAGTTGQVLTSNGAGAAPTFQTVSQGASVNRNNVDQTSVASITFTKIQHTTEVYDTDGWFDVSTNYRFTPLVAGKYLVIASAGFLTIADGKLIVSAIYKNGSNENQAQIRWGGAGDPFLAAAAIIEMNGSTDYLEHFAYHDDTGTKSIDGNPKKTFFQVIRVG